MLRFFSFFPNGNSQDLCKVNKKSIFARKTGHPEECIELEMLFPSEYPNDPPFIRVLQPRFALRSGHVTIGGRWSALLFSLCPRSSSYCVSAAFAWTC